ncbi:MAG TPA: PDZ domain-containing protein, partial [Gemmatimonadales bacterium]|nr:PDZ domain-containing protein [Gemmatimonadales bacterium]
SQLQQKVGFRKAGEAVQVTVVRAGGEKKTLAVRLAAAPSADADSGDVASADDGTPKRGLSAKEETLGISVEPLSQEDAREPSLRAVARAGGGLAVTSVSPDGPAYQKLVDATGGGYPDIILKINAQPTRTRAEFRAALASVKSGDIVTLAVLRYGPPDGWTQWMVRVRAR